MAKKGKGKNEKRYKVPAKKLEKIQDSSAKMGYKQKFGEERMSPGKMGDMTAAKMAHGDAAAKYYGGPGRYMNGAPKYEGAAKDDPVSGFGKAYADARKGGKETFDYDGKSYSTLSKEEAERDLRDSNRTIKEFTNPSTRSQLDAYGVGSKDYSFYPLMGYDNKQISENVQGVIDRQKKAAHALGKGKEATDYKNPFAGS
ncbi:MAG: hypothetical protein GY787_18215 [Alteromonadales bacterium]|nr:hypothetical protein [Alteromonadales bacterium]